MDRVLFYDIKSYDKTWFSALAPKFGIEPVYQEYRLDPVTARLAHGYGAVCAFVSDDLSRDTLSVLKECGVTAAALRCAGYNNADTEAGEELGIRIYRVPAYSPSSVAEHAMALLLSVARGTHRAFTRTRERNFSLEGLVGTDLTGRTAGIIGTGRVGAEFLRMCSGMGMQTVAYDPYPRSDLHVRYVPVDELCRRADVISLHCPLTPETYHLISRDMLSIMKKGVIIINTSRGALIDSGALLESIKDGRVGAAGLDVYEEEADVFYEDVSMKIMEDDTLNLLLSQPNVLVTGHQAFLTDDALKAIAEVTLDNLRRHFDGRECENLVLPRRTAAL